MWWNVCAELMSKRRRDAIDVFQNHAYYGTFPGFAILYGATVNAKQLLSRKKGYSTVTIAGKQAKVTCHNFSSESNRSKRKQWIRYWKGRRQAFKARLWVNCRWGFIYFSLKTRYRSAHRSSTCFFREGWSSLQDKRNLLLHTCQLRLYYTLMQWCDHADSFAVAIDIANVHLGLWTSSNSSVASSLAWKIINLLFR